MNLKERKLLDDPAIISRGFVVIEETDTLMEEACDSVRKTVVKKLSDNHVNKDRLSTAVRSTLINFMFRETGRRPLVMPIIMDEGDRK